MKTERLQAAYAARMDEVRGMARNELLAYPDATAVENAVKNNAPMFAVLANPFPRLTPLATAFEVAMRVGGLPLAA